MTVAIIRHILSNEGACQSAKDKSEAIKSFITYRTGIWTNGVKIRARYLVEYNIDP